MQTSTYQTSTYQEQFFAPYEWYRSMRATRPVFYDAQRNYWHVFRYSDVLRVLSEYATFSSDARTLEVELPAETPLLSSILRMDPPRHRQLRNLVTLAFTPRMVARLTPRIRDITDQLLDAVPATGDMDVVRDLAFPLPVTVIAELLGIPAQRREDFKRWSDALVSSRSQERKQGRAADLQSMYAYFTQIFEERRRQPQDDLISGLLAAEVEGQHLSDLELLGFCVLLLVAGNETTTNLISNSILCFDQNPEVVERLRADPSLIPSAVEEALRYLSPVKAMVRFTRTETTIGDQRISAKQWIMAWIASANRDEEHFPDPDRFDIQRDSNRHLAFGHGIHFCLGAPLARLEASIALTAMLERFPGSWHVSNVPLEPIQSEIVFGLKSLPMTLGE